MAGCWQKKPTASTATASKSWVDEFAGKWQDQHTTAQIVEDIHKARTNNSEIILWMDINIKAMRYTEERYEDSVKIYRDMRNTLDNAKKEGLEEGLIKGERNKAMEIATKMKAKGFSVDDIVQMTGLSAAEVKKIKH